MKTLRWKLWTSPRSDQVSTVLHTGWQQQPPWRHLCAPVMPHERQLYSCVHALSGRAAAATHAPDDETVEAAQPASASAHTSRRCRACNKSYYVVTWQVAEPISRCHAGTASAQHSAGGAHSSPSLKQPHAATVEFSNMALFLRRPAPHASHGQVLCCIERTKSGMGKHPT
jgi:hypothetical protein